MIDFILSGARDEGESAGSADHEGEREHQREHGPRLEVILFNINSTLGDG